MSILTIEAKVENGQIRLPDGVKLPEHARVFVVVPDIEITRETRVLSPSLVHPEQAADFTLEVFEDPSNARL